MEKHTPHCKLQVVRTLVDAGQVRATLSALSGAAALGLAFDDIVATVLALTPADFYKSMTTHTRPPHLAGRVPPADRRGRRLSQTHHDR